MASSLNHTHIKARVQKPYLIYDQNGQNQLKLIPHLWHAKQLKNVPYPLGPTYLYSQCNGVPPPFSGLLSKLLWRRSISQKRIPYGLGSFVLSLPQIWLSLLNWSIDLQLWSAVTIACVDGLLLKINRATSCLSLPLSETSWSSFKNRETGQLNG